jgi:hypothetical protein
MNFSNDDLRMIAKLRKRQQLLRRWRLPLLIGHGLLIVAWFILLMFTSRFDSENATVKLIVLVYMLPPIFFGIALSSAWFGYTLWNWRGEPKTDLLLKVIDELLKRDS